MFRSRYKMNEIYLSWVFCLSFAHGFSHANSVCVCAGVGVLCIHHHIYYMCTLCSHTSLPVIVSITSHTINSLLHYNEWMRNAKEKHSTGKHTWNIKCSQKNCDDMLHFRNRAFTSKPFFFNFVTYFSFHFFLSTSFHSSTSLYFVSRCIFVCVCFCLDSVVMLFSFLILFYTFYDCHGFCNDFLPFTISGCIVLSW